jgi:hypothetical protein
MHETDFDRLSTAKLFFWTNRICTCMSVVTDAVCNPLSPKPSRKGGNDKGAITLGLYPRRNGRS